MVATASSLVVGVRFRSVGKLYHFDASSYPDVQLGDYVIVETSRGRQIGQIMGFIPPDRVEAGRVKAIRRLATPRDLLMKQLYEAKEVTALIDCREAAADLGGYAAAKFVEASYTYDGSLMTVLFTSEETIDTNRLRRRLAQQFHCKVELRRIGARDAAKLLGEYGACGAPRCCSTHLTEFSPISIKMAKAQGISLNPSEITGMCGRLRCCLVYEYEQYVEARKKLPKRNKMVGTPYGEGKVIGQNPLAQTVTVIVEDARYEIHLDDLQPLEELRALQAKAGQGCVKEGGGICDCGARVRPARSEAPAERPSQDSSPAQSQPADSEKRRSKKRRSRRSRRSRGSGKGQDRQH